MDGIKQSMTMPYNLHGNSLCEGFNHTLQELETDLENQPNIPLYQAKQKLIKNKHHHIYHYGT